MPWVVDTCLVLDVLDADPDFGRKSAQLLDRKRIEGLVVCPVTFIELAPAFDGDLKEASFFLDQVGIAHESVWQADDTLNGFSAWNLHITQKRKGNSPKRPIADILIGAFALRFHGLLTRNTVDFKSSFPVLKVVSP